MPSWRSNRCVDSLAGNLRLHDANNSCGGRSLRYGTTRDNVISVEAMLADRRTARFGEVRADLSDLSMDHPVRALLSGRSA